MLGLCDSDSSSRDHQVLYHNNQLRLYLSVDLLRMLTLPKWYGRAGEDLADYGPCRLNSKTRRAEAGARGRCEDTGEALRFESTAQRCSCQHDVNYTQHLHQPFMHLIISAFRERFIDELVR